MYLTQMEFLEAVELSKYIVSIEERNEFITVTSWKEDEYEMSIMLNLESDPYIALQANQEFVAAAAPAIFRFVPPKNGREVVKLSETDLRSLYDDLVTTIRKAGYLGVYGNGSMWSRVIEDEEETDS